MIEHLNKQSEIFYVLYSKYGFKNPFLHHDLIYGELHKPMLAL